MVCAYDVWPLSQIPESARKGEILLVVWAYIDWEWTQNNVVVDRLSPALKVVPTSFWLERELRKSGLDNVSEPIYPGVNHDVYKPIVGKEITKERLRQSLGFPPNSFVITMLQMNQQVRKCFDLEFEGVKIFRESNPDMDVRVWCHSIPRTADGWPLPELALEYGLDYLKGDIKFADSYMMLKGLHGYNEDHISTLINSSDVLLQATTGDSVGMPTLESLSCGIPVVSTDFVGMTEVNPCSELRVKVLKKFHPPNLPMLTRAYPDPEDIARGLEVVLNGDPEYYRRKCTEFASRFTWEACLDGWLLVLDEVTDIIESNCLRIPPPSKSLEDLSKQIMVVS